MPDAARSRENYLWQRLNRLESLASDPCSIIFQAAGCPDPHPRQASAP